MARMVLIATFGFFVTMLVLLAVTLAGFNTLAC
jgi:uncharacterized membrane protein